MAVYLLLYAIFGLFLLSALGNPLNVCSELEQRILKLEEDNSELRLETARLRIENLHLRQENQEIAKNFPKVNYTIIAEAIENVQSNLAILTQDMVPIQSHLSEMLKQNTSNTNITVNDANEIKEEKTEKLPSNCAEAANGNSGIYTIEIPVPGTDSFPVLCDAETQYGGWTVIQQRMDGSTNFHRTWAEYKAGFGKLESEFFLGLEKIHKLTTYVAYELLVVIQDFNDVIKYANYESFVIGNESEKYKIKELGTYTGDAGDALRDNLPEKFSTYDHNIDPSSGNCAMDQAGGWWFYRCGASNLNGLYMVGGNVDSSRGVRWNTFHDSNYSHKMVKMMIRPRTVLPAICKKFISH